MSKINKAFLRILEYSFLRINNVFLRIKKTKKKGKRKIIEKILLILFFSSTTLLYLHNLTRDIYSGDLGDLVTAAYVFGVPHPSGYPLFTFLGFLLTRLPLPLPPVSKVGLISVFSSIAALFFYFKLSQKATKSFLISLLSTSILAFSYLFWIQAEIPELFALNHFFIVIIFYFATLFYLEKKPLYLYLLVFFSALSITHHHTIVLIFPAVLLLVLRHIKIVFQSIKRVAFLIFLFLLGLLPYIYVPIAASRDPVINWDNASNLKNFINLFLRADYGIAPSLIQTAIPPLIKLIVVKAYFNSLASSLTIPVLMVILLGALSLLKNNKLVLVSYVSAFILTGPFLIYYGAEIYTTIDSWGIMERFHSISSIVAAFFIPYGFLLIKNILDQRFSKKMYTVLILIEFFIISLALLRYNVPRTDLSKTHIGNNLAIDMLSSLPQNGVILLDADTVTLNMWYARYVLNVRTDVDIISRTGAGGNYYLKQEFLKDKKAKVPYLLISEDVLLYIKQKRPVFSTYPAQYRNKDIMLLPRGIVYEVIDKKNIPSKGKYMEDIEKRLRTLHIPRRETLLPSERNFITSEIPLVYSNGLVEVGGFIERYYDDPEKANDFYKKAVWIDKENPNAYANLGLNTYKISKNCNEAIKNLETAISVYSFFKPFYVNVYTISEKCNNTQKSGEIKKEYKRRFAEDIEEEIKRQKQNGNPNFLDTQN